MYTTVIITLRITSVVDDIRNVTHLQVILYAGKTTTGRKVAEYGGNAFGVGSRGVVRLGWPKEPVKVEGDAVTIFFQLKSTRERNTPDNAVWGFSCIISTKVLHRKGYSFKNLFINVLILEDISPANVFFYS